MNIEKIVQKYPSNLRETIFKEIMHYEILESSRIRAPQTRTALNFLPFRISGL